MRVCGRGMRVWREGMRARSMRRGSGGERRAFSVERRASRRGEGEGEGETKSRVPRHPAELTCTSRCPCWRRRRAHVAAQDSSKRLAAGRCDATPLDALRAPAVPVPSPSSRRQSSSLKPPPPAPPPPPLLNTPAHTSTGGALGYREIEWFASDSSAPIGEPVGAAGRGAPATGAHEREPATL